MDELKEYDFNIRKARQTVTVFIASSIVLIALIIITENDFSAKLSEYKFFFIPFALGYSCFIFLLIKRYFNSYSTKPKIFINQTEILIPTYYLGEKKIPKHDIYSLEKLHVNNKLIGVNLGIRNKGGYILDKYRFEQADDFQKLCDYLCQFIEETVSIEKNTIIDRVKEKQKTNIAFFSYIACVVAITFFLIGAGSSFKYSDNIDFLLLGANTKATLNEFEIYRIASSTFLHISIFHLLLNLMMLGIFSQFLEKALSYVRFANLFLFSSTIAVLVSAWLSPFDASIGASGGLFGLWGAYTVLKLRHEENLPGSINAIPTRRFYIILVVEIILEVFVIENVDYINHLGGFIAGFLYLYLAPLGPRLETIDQPVLPEKGLFAVLALFYTLSLGYFLMLYYELL